MNVPVDATNIQFNVYTHSVIGWGTSYYVEWVRLCQ